MISDDPRQPERYRLGDLQLDAGRRTVSRHGRRIRLPGLSFDLLLTLARHAPDLVSTDRFMEEVWRGRVVNAETVAKRVEMVRHALGDDSQEPRYIGLVRGHGYQLLAPVEPVGTDAFPPPRSRLFYLLAAGLTAIALLLGARVLWHDSARAMTPSVVVLPFENRSAREEDAFFVDGMHDDLLTLLAQVGDFKVISRTSAVRLDPDMSIREIGRELDVATVIEGGVQRAGDRVWVNVQLIDAATEAHLWADRYDRQLTAANLYEIQRDIVTAIADNLEAELSPQGQEQLDTVPTHSMAALEAYFRGRQRLARRTTESMAQAMESFEEAVDLDPDFALAHVGLADSLLLHALYTEQQTEQTLDRVEAIAARAMALDGNLGEAHATLGLSREVRGDHAGAERAYARALELNPNYATAHHWYSILLAVREQREEALVQIEKARALEPLSAVITGNLTQHLRAVGRFDEALMEMKRVVEMDPAHVSIYDPIATIHWQAFGRLDEAVPWYEKLTRLEPGNPAFCAWYAWLLLDLGDDVRAEEWLARSMELSPDNFSASLVGAMFHRFRGEGAASARNARKVLVRHDPGWAYLRPLAAPYAINFELETGRYAQARALLEEAFPLLAGDEPRVDRGNYRPAIELARVLRRIGEDERAARLLEHSLEVLGTLPRLGYRGYWISDVQIYALQSKTDRALSALRDAIDEGWRVLWWYYLEMDPNLKSIRAEAEFQAMLEEVRADIATQRARVRASESPGGNLEARAGTGRW